MPKLLLASAIALSFVAVQGRVQRAKASGAAEQLVRSGMPTSPLPTVSLGQGTTRAIEKDRHLVQFVAHAGVGIPTTRAGTDSLDCPWAALVTPSSVAPSLHLRI